MAIADIALHASEITNLVFALASINRIANLGYPDSRVTGLTTVQSLIDDIETFRDLASVKASDRPIFDAAVDSIRWLGLRGILTTTIVTGLLTVRGGAADETDLRYNVTAQSDFPSDVEVGYDDISVFQPAA